MQFVGVDPSRSTMRAGVPVEAIYYEDDLPDRQHSLISYYS